MPKSKKKIMKEIAKKKSKLCPCSAYGGTPDRQNTRLLRFFALFGAQKPYTVESTRGELLFGGDLKGDSKSHPRGTM